MNKFLRKAMVLALAGTMTMGMGTTVFAEDTAADVTRDNTSKFTTGGISASTGVENDTFYLIKDYDSVNPTASNPNSQSPAETFTYEITPYAVWNAGSTYNNSADHTGEATKIGTSNMPMLTLSDNSGVSGDGDSRKLTVNQKVEIGGAKYEKGSDNLNAGDEKTAIKLPTYDTVGDYWYKVVEKDGKTTGVIYGTNSNASSGTDGDTTADNANYSRVYYIHVQVTGANAVAGSSKLVKNVTMHKSAPEAKITNETYNNTYAQKVDDKSDGLYKAGNKVNAIENKYYAGNLVIKKEVTGNAGDKSQYFQVTVKFTKPAGTIINSDITFTAFDKTTNNNVDTYESKAFTIKGQYDTDSTESNTNIKWITQNGATSSDAAKTATCTFYVKDATEVTFNNIPYGINYIIEETQPKDDTYTHKFSFDSTSNSDNVQFDGSTDLKVDTVTEEGDTWSNAKAVGSITDPNDTVIITNNKDSVIDIGVITSNAPYVAVLILAAAALVIYTRRRKDMFEE